MVQFNPETNSLFGRKYLRNSAGELALAPVSRSAALSIKNPRHGSNEAAKNWSSQADFSAFYQSHQQKLQALSTQLAKRRPGITINLSAEDLSYMDLTRIFGGYQDLAHANLQGANLT
ncbi:MAG TPA: hypothetical protein ACHBX0_07480 [Arsenophonus sp.]